MTKTTDKGGNDMESTMIFGISPIFALLPLIIYIILAFKDINPVLNVVICVVLSAIMTKQPFSSMGEVLGSALGSFRESSDLLSCLVQPSAPC